MFLDELTAFRIREDDLKMISKITRQDREKYDSESHFIRIAVLKLIREERARLKLKWLKKDLNRF